MGKYIIVICNFIFPICNYFCKQQLFHAVAEYFFGITFLLISIMYVVLCYTLYLADKQNEALYTVIYRPWKFTIYFLIQILGFIVGYFYAPAVIISTILATLV